MARKRQGKIRKFFLHRAQEFGRAVGLEVLPATAIGINPVKDALRIVNSRELKTVFDVGANEGQTALQFARSFPNATIYSFEPFPTGFNKLAEHAKTHPNIRPFNIALGDASGTQKLFLTRSSFTHSLLRTVPQARDYLGKRVDPAGEIDVSIRTLDEFCAKREITRIDLLKLDVQGYELKILAGATRLLDAKQITLLFTEVNFVPLYENQAYFHQVYQFLLGQEFQLVSFYNQTHREGPELNWADALFVNKKALGKLAGSGSV